MGMKTCLSSSISVLEIDKWLVNGVKFFSRYQNCDTRYPVGTEIVVCLSLSSVRTSAAQTSGSLTVAHVTRRLSDYWCS